MLPNWNGIKFANFANFGQNNQVLYKNRENLENICSIYIWGSSGVKVCTVVVHKFSKDIIYDFKLNMSKISQFGAK